MSSQVLAFRQTQSQQPVSPLFRLPTELRLIIYGFALEESPAPREFALHEAVKNAPSPALLLTCQAILDEAHDVFDPATRAYWTTHTFTLNPADRYIKLILSIPSKYLQRVQRVRILPHGSGSHRTPTVEIERAAPGSTFWMPWDMKSAVWQPGSRPDFFFKGDGRLLAECRKRDELAKRKKNGRWEEREDFEYMLRWYCGAWVE